MSKQKGRMWTKRIVILTKPWLSKKCTFAGSSSLSFQSTCCLFPNFIGKMELYKHFIQVLYFVYQRNQHYKFTDDSQMNLCAVIGAREGKMQAKKQINPQCCSILLQKGPHTIEQFDYLFSINKTKMFNFFKFTHQTNEVAGDTGTFLLYKIKRFPVKSRSFFM